MTTARKDTLIAIFGACLYVMFVVWLIIHDYKHVGSWGWECKDNKTCKPGLVCIYDHRGKSSANRFSICLDPNTMHIGDK